MAKRSRGFRSGTRRKLAKSAREKGAPPVTHAMRRFAPGAPVNIDINPSVHAGMPHPRFNGRAGTVLSQRGKSFEVEVVVGKKPKILLARPEHLTARV
ncbi:MAG: 50S ribosomal protein L21e [Methanobacteriota archaeon]